MFEKGDKKNIKCNLYIHKLRRGWERISGRIQIRSCRNRRDDGTFHQTSGTRHRTLGIPHRTSGTRKHVSAVEAERRSELSTASMILKIDLNTLPFWAMIVANQKRLRSSAVFLAENWNDFLCM